jgi:hypothetical protein
VERRARGIRRDEAFSTRLTRRAPLPVLCPAEDHPPRCSDASVTLGVGVSGRRAASAAGSRRQRSGKARPAGRVDTGGPRGRRGVGLRRGADVAVSPFPQAARPNRACDSSPHTALRVSHSLINRRG